MEAPVTPQPNHRFKTMQQLTTPSGHVFEYCIDSDDNDCDVTSQIEGFIETHKEYLSILEDMYGIKK